MRARKDRMKALRIAMLAVVMIFFVGCAVPVGHSHYSPYSSDGWMRGVKVYSPRPHNRGYYQHYRPEDAFGRRYGDWVRENRGHGPYGVIPPNRIMRHR